MDAFDYETGFLRSPLREKLTEEKRQKVLSTCTVNDFKCEYELTPIVN